MAEMSTRWTEAQRRIYGRVFRYFTVNQAACCHPDMAKASAEHWETIAHNAAWLAAEFLEPGEFVFRDSETNEIVASTNVSLH